MKLEKTEILLKQVSNQRGTMDHEIEILEWFRIQ